MSKFLYLHSYLEDKLVDCRLYVKHFCLRSLVQIATYGFHVPIQNLSLSKFETKCDTKFQYIFCSGCDK